MSADRTPLRDATGETLVEAERYEFREPSPYTFALPELARRDFLRVLTAMGGGLLVVSALPASAQESGRGGGFRQEGSPELASWLHIGASGEVTVYTGKVEIGQNIRTSLAQTVGDELGVPMTAISMVMADTDLTPYDMGTFGSRTTPTMAPVLARAAATAREMLIGEAASRWHVGRTGLQAKDGRVVSPSGQSLSYGELTKGQQFVGAVAANPPEMPRTAWALRGTPLHKVNARDIVTGKHQYPADMAPADVHIGKIVRPAAIGATAGAVDESGARAMPGVTVVRDAGLIGVVAPNERVAVRAAAAVHVDWQMPTGLPSSQTIYDYLRSKSRGGPSAAGTAEVAAARSAAAHVFEETYLIPYIAHVPLEPRAAVAEWNGDKLTVWTGTQRPFGVRGELAQAFRIPEERVRVIVPDMGSGYGGKHTGEAAIEAARLAKAAGHPVKLVYTRAEEFMWGYFRPAGVIDARAGVDASGRLTFWEFDNYNSGGSGLNTPYDVPVRREQFHESDSPLRQGSYRGLAATANHYAREMHMDTVARALGVDAALFRLKHISDARLQAVLSSVVKNSGWPRPSTAGARMGIACGTEKGSYIATAAEVVKTPEGFRVTRVVATFECGAIVNPDGLNHQVEGAVIMGLGGALFEAIQFADGRILNGTMRQYRVPRFQDIPPIEVSLLDRKDLASAGAGETPIVCVAPAIGSAVRAFGDVTPALPVTLKS